MVSLSGAEQAQPLVIQINTLDAAVATLATALTNADTIAQITMLLTSADGRTSSQFSVTYPLNSGDSTAILNDIKNVLANEAQTLTNTLGQIT